MSWPKFWGEKSSFQDGKKGAVQADQGFLSARASGELQVDCQAYLGVKKHLYLEKGGEKSYDQNLGVSKGTYSKIIWWCLCTVKHWNNVISFLTILHHMRGGPGQKLYISIITCEWGQHCPHRDTGRHFWVIYQSSEGHAWTLWLFWEKSSRANASSLLQPMLLFMTMKKLKSSPFAWEWTPIITHKGLLLIYLFLLTCTTNMKSHLRQKSHTKLYWKSPTDEALPPNLLPQKVMRPHRGLRLLLFSNKCGELQKSHTGKLFSGSKRLKLASHFCVKGLRLSAGLWPDLSSQGMLRESWRMTAVLRASGFICATFSQ